MYISSIKIKGYLGFKDLTVDFKDGVNVILGHNNAGKSNLLKALALVIDSNTPKRLGIDDFHKGTTLEALKASPPSVEISITIKKSDQEDPYSDDLATVGMWLTKLENPYEAMLTYRFYLPDRQKQAYTDALSEVPSIDAAWLCIKHEFLRNYKVKLLAGDPSLLNTADPETIQKFDFQFLNAIRDVERDMFTGRNTLLREVLDFFLDHDLKVQKGNGKTKEEVETEIKARKSTFSEDAGALITKLQERMESGKKEILAYAERTGASFDKAEPDFEGTLSEPELFSALKLIIKHGSGLKIPATHNGLGYNNLIYISLLLAKMQVEADADYNAENPKVFPMLAIEEPEAHLHPSMQYLFLKFLKENSQGKTRKVRQLFVTTHSTQITSAVTLDEIICLHKVDGQTKAAYPGKAFDGLLDGQKSKAHVQRFMDATKADMLFAKSLILVEGIAEQWVIPALLKYHGLELEEHHALIVNMGGRYFDHFLPLFDGSNENAIPKRVACITDRDPSRKKKEPGAKWKGCFPFEMKANESEYEYKDHAGLYLESYALHDNIQFYSQDEKGGWTFEHDLLLNNPQLEMLVTDAVDNDDEILELMALFGEAGRTYQDMIERLSFGRPGDGEKEARIKIPLSRPDWSEEEKKKAIVAFRYLKSVSKGANASELNLVLRENFDRPETAPLDETGVEVAGVALRQAVVVPNYIIQAGKWACHLEPSVATI